MDKERIDISIKMLEDREKELEMIAGGIENEIKNIEERQRKVQAQMSYERNRRYKIGVELGIVRDLIKFLTEEKGG